MAAPDSEVGTKVDGMPLLGGKGGDGFDNIPLFIAWDSSAVKERATFQWFEGTAQGLELELRSVLIFQAKYNISWLCHLLDSSS